MTRFTRILSNVLLAALLALIAVTPGMAHDPGFTETFDRDRCTFTSTGNNPYFPLWPRYALHLAGEEEDDEGELVEISARITVLTDTEMVDGVLTRVVEEREEEDGELVEISRNFYALCRETGDLWYFGEDVDDYEDGMIVGHDGEWRAGRDGAVPGIVMPGTPYLGARFFEEVAPGVALDRGEIVSLDASIVVPFGSFDNLLQVEESDAFDPDDLGNKWYAHGVGNIKDNELELEEITLPPCLPDTTTHCLQDGRFAVSAEWELPDGSEGVASAVLPSADSGEFYFFNANNTEILVKVLDGCNNSTNSFWVFAAGLTNLGVTLTVMDTATNQVREYESSVGTSFQPILDTSAFQTCP